MANSTFATGMDPSGKLRLALSMAFIGVSGGTIGFMFLESMDPLSALYMTIITLSTVGFGEIMPLHPAGRVFVIFLILFGVTTAGVIVTLVGEQLLEGHVKHLVTRRKMEAKLKKMSDHFIIAGFGRVGQQVARKFQIKGVQFVVIEKDEQLVNRVLDEGFVPVMGDATDDEVLLSAGIESANTLISTLPEEAQNVYLTLTARYMKPDLHIIARADFEDGEKKLLRAGANHVIIPHVLGGIRMAKAALQPNVVDFMQMTSMDEEDLLIEELVVPDGSPLTGKSLEESNLRREFSISIVGIKQTGKKMNINPGSSAVLNGQDILVVIGQAEDLERFSSHITR
ncbi:MAG: potassium channel protein [Candidatus Zixiibacteriota bacterium]|nr:MAG: potassium channel protein [candidate division Zixibacteria bacterium]